MIRKLLVLAALGLLALLVACGGNQAPPTFEPLPTPTIPANFITFTDESNLFSIAYPSEWEMVGSLSADRKEITQAIVEAKRLNISSGSAGTVFFAGFPIDPGFDPSVTIVVGSFSGAMSVDKMFEGLNQEFKQRVTGFESHTQTKISVGGRESIIQDMEFDLSSIVLGETGKARVIQLATTDGSVGWTVTCSSLRRQSASDLQSCNASVRSFRVLE